MKGIIEDKFMVVRPHPQDSAFALCLPLTTYLADNAKIEDQWEKTQK